MSFPPTYIVKIEKNNRVDRQPKRIFFQDKLRQNILGTSIRKKYLVGKFKIYNILKQMLQKPFLSVFLKARLKT